MPEVRILCPKNVIKSLSTRSQWGKQPHSYAGKVLAVEQICEVFLVYLDTYMKWC
jgi:hypothetical protein